MKKIIFIAIIVVVALAVGVRYFTSVRSAHKEGPYQFVEITRGDLENVISSTGTLNPVGTVEIGTQVSGTIDRIEVDFNDQVRKGQVLAVLDTALLKVAMLDVEAGLARAQAQYEQARAEYRRNLDLFEKGHLSEKEFLPIRINVKTTQATVQSAQAALKRAQINMKHAIIRSPINGTVIQRNVEPGQTVAASFATPTLFIIAEDLSKMEIYAAVDESDIGQIQEGQSVRFTVEAYPDETFYGTVRQIRLQPTTIQNVVNYTVVVDASNRDGLLLPGMTATVDFVVEERKDVWLIPNAAFRFQPTQEMITEFRKGLRERLNALPDSLKQPAQQRRTQRGQFGRGMPLPSQSGAQSDVAQLWVLDENDQLSVIPVRKGATDGLMTEITMLDVHRGPPGGLMPRMPRVHLEEGRRVISGVTHPKKQDTKTTRQGPPGPGFGRRPF